MKDPYNILRDILDIKSGKPTVDQDVNSGKRPKTYIRTATTATVRPYHVHSSARRADMAAAAAASVLLSLADRLEWQLST